MFVVVVFCEQINIKNQKINKIESRQCKHVGVETEPLPHEQEIVGVVGTTPT